MRSLLFLLASIFVACGCNDTAANDLDLETAGRLAMQKSSLGNVVAARSDIDKILDSDIGAKDYFSHFLCGVIYGADPNGKVTLSKELQQKSIDCFERSLALRPEYEATWRMYLSLLSEAGRDHEAVALFERMWNQYKMPKEHSVNAAIYIVEDSFIRVGKEDALLQFYSELVNVRERDKNMLFRYRKLKKDLSTE